jgi:hypothetical protein
VFDVNSYQYGFNMSDVPPSTFSAQGVTEEVEQSVPYQQTQHETYGSNIQQSAHYQAMPQEAYCQNTGMLYSHNSEFNTFNISSLSTSDLRQWIGQDRYGTGIANTDGPYYDATVATFDPANKSALNAVHKATAFEGVGLSTSQPAQVAGTVAQATPNRGNSVPALGAPTNDC